MPGRHGSSHYNTERNQTGKYPCPLDIWWRRWIGADSWTPTNFPKEFLCLNCLSLSVLIVFEWLRPTCRSWQHHLWFHYRIIIPFLYRQYLHRHRDLKPCLTRNRLVTRDIYPEKGRLKGALAAIQRDVLLSYRKMDTFLWVAPLLGQTSCQSNQHRLHPLPMRTN